jgi:hypothetical protein
MDFTAAARDARRARSRASCARAATFNHASRPSATSTSTSHARRPLVNPLLMTPTHRAHAARLSDDAYLEPFRPARRDARRAAWCTPTTGAERLEAAARPAEPLEDFAAATSTSACTAADGWVFREWAPNATAVHLSAPSATGEDPDALRLRRINAQGDWELRLPATPCTTATSTACACTGRRRGRPHPRLRPARRAGPRTP